MTHPADDFNRKGASRVQFNLEARLTFREGVSKMK